MGQQQLLLVILVTIIVGIATVVAINTFGSAADSANIDAVRQDLATFASSAQGYFMKPEMLGGGGGDWEDITFNTVAFPAEEISTDGLSALNANGVYTFSAPGATDTVFQVTAYPSSRIDGPVTIDVTDAGGNGPLVADIGPGGITWVEND